jgi:hypothetical protein
MDGIVGSLVIRRPRSQDPLTRLYDFDLPSHVILLTDWLHTTTDTRLPGNRFANTGSLPESILANGRTQYFYVSKVVNFVLGTAGFLLSCLPSLFDFGTIRP